MACAAIGAALGVVVAGEARAAEATRAVSGYWAGKTMELDVSLSYRHDQKRAFIKRELQAGDSPARLIKDLIYQQTRDVMSLRLGFGLIHDLSLHFELPIVLRDDRQLDFDQSEGNACTFTGASPRCVNEGNSTILRDGILPGANQPMYGVDATHVDAASPRGRPFSRPSTMVFRGPRRRGVEALGLGLGWAPFNQRRDASKPTWIVGIDGRFDVASSMRYDAARPDANTGVGLGYHQVILYTTISRRLGNLDPYVGFFYAHPLVPDGSLYARLPVGSQPYADPQRRAGLQLGLEHIAWENEEAKQRVTLEVRARAEHRFQGRSASELWEPLSGASTCVAGNPTPASCRPPGQVPGMGVGIDYNGLGNASPHPGITETQAYSAANADVGINVQVGRYARFRGLFGFATELPHFITFGTAGEDKDGVGGVDSTNPAEANPVYREVIDLPGRRFKVEGTQIWSLFFEGTVSF
jgi:hypothetical protein